MSDTTKRDDWRLDSIKLEFQNYGEEKGKYTGKITFQNGEYESFSFKIRPEMAERYIQVLSKDIVNSASQLGERLTESLGLKKQDDK